MKTKKLFISIFVMAVVAFTLVTVVSCKKDNQNALLGNNNETSKSFDMRQIDDMGAYLKDFKHKMLESKDGEALSLEDAAWHLASLANYEHCNINVHFDDVRFDTIYMQVNVTGGNVLMDDLCVAYEQMWPAIKKFQNSLGLDNQNLRFVNMSIADDGNAKIALMTTSCNELRDHLWYFSNATTLDSVCNCYYGQNSVYQWNTYATSNLTNVINIFEGNHYTDPQSSCYIPTRFYVFNYNFWIDQYNQTPFYYNSRLFAKYSLNDPYSFSCYLNFSQMSYCTDSYLGMGIQYLNDNYYVDDEYPISWSVSADYTQSSTPTYYIYHHKLMVQYGQLCIVDPNPGHN